MKKNYIQEQLHSIKTRHLELFGVTDELLQGENTIDPTSLLAEQRHSYKHYTERLELTKITYL